MIIFSPIDIVQHALLKRHHAIVIYFIDCHDCNHLLFNFCLSKLLFGWQAALLYTSLLSVICVRYCSGIVYVNRQIYNIVVCIRIETSITICMYCGYALSVHTARTNSQSTNESEEEGRKLVWVISKNINTALVRLSYWWNDTYVHFYEKL